MARPKTKAQWNASVDALLSDPKGQDMLARIARAEMGEAWMNDYDRRIKGLKFDSFDSFPQDAAETVRYKDNKTGKAAQVLSTAAGRYQINKPTYEEFSKRLGITDFTPESQDRIAAAIMVYHGADQDIREGDYVSAINKLGGRWASLPSSKSGQPQKSLEQFFSPRGIGSVPEGVQVPSDFASAQVASKRANPPATPDTPQEMFEGNLQNAGAMQGTAPHDLIAELMGPSGGPTLPFTENGRGYIAIPETQEEADRLTSFQQGGYSPDMNAQLVRVMKGLQGAEADLAREANLAGDSGLSADLFDTLPTENDDLIRRLIAQV